MALLDMLGRRWVLRILWELREDSLTFRELREHCDAMSPTVLNQRLRELRDAGIVVLNEPAGYALASSGRQLLEALMPLQRWAEQWQGTIAAQEQTKVLVEENDASTAVKTPGKAKPGAKAKRRLP
ncbi:helix-turn-helix domain-containing protein [Noviherbaspirillum saxi]